MEILKWKKEMHGLNTSSKEMMKIWKKKRMENK